MPRRFLEETSRETLSGKLRAGISLMKAAVGFRRYYLCF